MEIPPEKSWMHNHLPSEVSLGRSPVQGQPPHTIHGGEEMPPTGQTGQSYSQNSSPPDTEGIRILKGVGPASVQLLHSS